MIGSAAAPRLRLEGVSKEYRQRTSATIAALRSVSVAIESGEFVSVEGPSGCGKTTLLNLVGLLDTPSGGRLWWNNDDTRAWSERERSRRRLTAAGFIFQRFYLLPTLTARENVELPMRALGVSAARRLARSSELLQRVGLTGRADSFPHQLSGGEEQRVAVARALANGPGLVLADEPTGELDRANAAGILELIVEAHRDFHASVVLVTHNPSVAAAADRHLRMEDGSVVADSRRE